MLGEEVENEGDSLETTFGGAGGRSNVGLATGIARG